ncbi:MAG: hypothetical protein Q9227_002892 [Pyrenula ochraceoflavens]
MAVSDHDDPGFLSGSSHASRNRRRPQSRGKRDVSGGQASWASSVINLVNTIVGAGVLAMPLAMSHMGIVLGIFVILWAGLTAGFGLYLQTRCARYLEKGSASFFALSQITYPNAAVIFDAAIAVKCFGVGNMFSILNEIKTPSPFRTTSVVVASIGTAASIYILVAITGYLSFGNEVGDNIIAQYAPSTSTTVGRAALVIMVMFSYPLQVHPCRASVDAVLKWRPNSKSKSKRSVPTSADSSPPRNIPLIPPTGKKRDSDMSDIRFSLITTVIIILSYIVAMTVSSLSTVLAYVGSTGSTSISFILPGLFYYKISSPDSPLHQQLLKEEDDYDADEEDGDEDIGESRTLLSNSGMLSGSGLLSGSQVLIRRTKRFRRELLRKLSLALAIYGLCVMIVCLITNTFFIVAH